MVWKEKRRIALVGSCSRWGGLEGTVGGLWWLSRIWLLNVLGKGKD